MSPMDPPIDSRLPISFLQYDKVVAELAAMKAERDGWCRETGYAVDRSDRYREALEQIARIGKGTTYEYIADKALRPADRIEPSQTGSR